MKPMVGLVRSRSKIASTFPRDVFYSPAKYQGFAVMHPWYRQELVHFITLCKETVHGSPTGELLRANAEQLRLKIGLPGHFTEAHLHVVSGYATHCLFMDLYRFLHPFKIGLYNLLAQLQKHPAHDVFLLIPFIPLGFQCSHLCLQNTRRQAP